MLNNSTEKESYKGILQKCTTEMLREDNIYAVSNDSSAKMLIHNIVDYSDLLYFSFTDYLCSVQFPEYLSSQYAGLRIEPPLLVQSKQMLFEILIIMGLSGVEGL